MLGQPRRLQPPSLRGARQVSQDRGTLVLDTCHPRDSRGSPERLFRSPARRCPIPNIPSFIVSSSMWPRLGGSMAWPSNRGGVRMAVESPARVQPTVDAIAARAGRVDREARFPRESIDELAAAGALGLAVPERFGGAGAGPVEIAEAVERVAGARASTGMVFVMHVVALQTLAAGVTDDEPEGPKHAALASAAGGGHPPPAG